MKPRTKIAWLCAALILTGYGLLVLWFGWRAGVAIFLIQWAGNIDQNIAKSRSDDAFASRVVDAIRGMR